jgi:hypothetical protein
MIDLQEAVAALRREIGEDDVEIASRLAQSENWAERVCGANWDDTWTGETLPGEIKSAIFARLQGLYDGGDYFQIASMLIEPWRDHVLA